MTGPEHYREAERLLDAGSSAADWEAIVAAAQVHATLALAAATAYPAVVDYDGGEGRDSREWAGVA